MPRMKFRIGFVDGQYANFSGQQCVCPPAYGPTIHSASRLDIRHLSMRVNARIGTAGTGDVYVLIEQLLEGLLKFTLDGAKIRLNLPSMKVRTVIGKSQLEVAHPNRL